jgi:hypothetical protein
MFQNRTTGEQPIDGKQVYDDIRRRVDFGGTFYYSVEKLIILYRVLLYQKILLFCHVYFFAQSVFGQF